MPTLYATTSFNALKNDEVFDQVVIGSGAGGMAAALFAAIKGFKVLIVERTEYVGGTTALSGGTTWAPLTRYLADTPTDDSFEKVMTFLDAAVGEFSDRSQREAFINASASAIHTLVDHTEVAFRACGFHPDYLADLPHATTCGRALEPLPYVGRTLGKHLSLLRPPIPEFTVLGGMMVNREDIGHLLKRFKSPKSFGYTVKLLLNYLYDRIRFKQTSRSVMGHALIARMLKSVLDRNIYLVTETELTAMSSAQDSGVDSIQLTQAGQTKRLKIKHGLILASGGFSRHAQRRLQFMPSGLSAYSPSAPGNTSNLHDQIEDLGAYYDDDADQPSFYAPVSIRRRADGSTAVFPHFVFDRSKPGTLCVNNEGQRFVNESLSYHDFVKEMLKGGAKTQTAWIIADANAIAKYGLGMVRLGGDDLRPYIDDGYLIKADSLEELAEKTGTQSKYLIESIRQINQSAETGIDLSFHRGSNVYQRANGDPHHTPNPTLGKLSQAPYYAVKLYAGDIGAAKGFKGNANGQLLKRDGQPIPRLYACGNDLDSIMGGTYPGPGITIGPAIVFAYLAIEHQFALSQRNNNK